MSGGKKRANYDQFLSHFRDHNHAPSEDADLGMLKDIWRRIDADDSGFISKLEFVTFVAAINKDPEVAAVVLLGVDTGSLFSTEGSFDAASAAFDAMSGGSSRGSYAQFVDHFRGAAPSKDTDVSILKDIWGRIDADSSGAISRLEFTGFIAAMNKDREVAALVLPGVDTGALIDSEESFGAVDAAFDAISGGKSRGTYAEFVNHFRGRAPSKDIDENPMLDIWRRIDGDGSGEISKLEFIAFVAAINKDPEVAILLDPGRLVPGADTKSLISSEGSFDAANAVFDTMSGGKSRGSYAEFVYHFRGAAPSKDTDVGILKDIWSRIDADGSGSISRLEFTGFIAAMNKDPEVAALVLPHVDTGPLLDSEEQYGAIDAAFDSISGGKARGTYAEFVNHFRGAALSKDADVGMLKDIWSRIDADGSGSISKLEFVAFAAAINKDPEVAVLLDPARLRAGTNSGSLISSEHSFEAANAVFDAMSGGKSRGSYAEFVDHFRGSAPSKDADVGILKDIWTRIDADGSGAISRLELTGFIAAMNKDPEVAALFLPGSVIGSLVDGEETFGAVDATFDAISGGNARGTYAKFVDHFRGAVPSKDADISMLKDIWRRIDADGSGSISKLEFVAFIAAINKDPEVAVLLDPSRLLPGVDTGLLVSSEGSFQAANAVFDTMSGGKSRGGYAEFVNHFRGAAPSKDTDLGILKDVWTRIDADGSGSISRLEFMGFIAAMNKDPEVAALVIPGIDTGPLLDSEESFEAVDAVFNAISGGKSRGTYAEFVDHFGSRAAPRAAEGGSRSRGARSGGCRGAPPSKDVGADSLEDTWRRIDADGSGSISKLELIAFLAGVNEDPELSASLLPGVDTRTLLSSEHVFSSAGVAFDAIPRGNPRVRYAEFVDHFSDGDKKWKDIWKRIDADGGGTISKLEFITAVNKDTEVAATVLPDVDPSSLLTSEDSFDAANETFDAMSGGKSRVSYEEFVNYFRKGKDKAFVEAAAAKAARESQAAVNIQRHHRGASARRQLRAERAQRVAEAEAAVCIQRHHRGACARRQVRDARAQKDVEARQAAVCIQRHYRGASSRRQLRAERARRQAEADAAVCIQRHRRGATARRSARRQLTAARAQTDTEAAVYIQRHYRGAAGRRQAREQRLLMVDVEAAKCIQRHFRAAEARRALRRVEEVCLRVESDRRRGRTGSDGGEPSFARRLAQRLASYGIRGAEREEVLEDDEDGQAARDRVNFFNVVAEVANERPPGQGRSRNVEPEASYAHVVTTSTRRTEETMPEVPAPEKRTKLPKGEVKCFKVLSTVCTSDMSEVHKGWLPTFVRERRRSSVLSADTMTTMSPNTPERFTSARSSIVSGPFGQPVLGRGGSSDSNGHLALPTRAVPAPSETSSVRGRSPGKMRRWSFSSRTSMMSEVAFSLDFLNLLESDPAKRADRLSCYGETVEEKGIYCWLRHCQAQCVASLGALLTSIGAFMGLVHIPMHYLSPDVAVLLAALGNFLVVSGVMLWVSFPTDEVDLDELFDNRPGIRRATFLLVAALFLPCVMMSYLFCLPILPLTFGLLGCPNLVPAACRPRWTTLLSLALCLSLLGIGVHDFAWATNPLKAAKRVGGLPARRSFVFPSVRWFLPLSVISIVGFCLHVAAWGRWAMKMPYVTDGVLGPTLTLFMQTLGYFYCRGLRDLALGAVLLSCSGTREQGVKVFLCGLAYMVPALTVHTKTFNGCYEFTAKSAWRQIGFRTPHPQANRSPGCTPIVPQIPPNDYALDRGAAAALAGRPESPMRNRPRRSPGEHALSMDSVREELEDHGRSDLTPETGPDGRPFAVSRRRHLSQRPSQRPLADAGTSQPHRHPGEGAGAARHLVPPVPPSAAGSQQQWQGSGVSVLSYESVATVPPAPTGRGCGSRDLGFFLDESGLDQSFHSSAQAGSPSRGPSRDDSYPEGASSGSSSSHESHRVPPAHAPMERGAAPAAAAVAPPPVMYAQPVECPVSFSAAPQPAAAPAEAVFVQAALPLAYSAAPQPEAALLQSLGQQITYQAQPDEGPGWQQERADAAPGPPEPPAGTSGSMVSSQSDTHPPGPPEPPVGKRGSVMSYQSDQQPPWPPEPPAGTRGSVVSYQGDQQPPGPPEPRAVKKRVSIASYHSDPEPPEPPTGNRDSASSHQSDQQPPEPLAGKRGSVMTRPSDQLPPDPDQQPLEPPEPPANQRISGGGGARQLAAVAQVVTEGAEQSEGLQQPPDPDQQPREPPAPPVNKRGSVASHLSYQPPPDPHQQVLEPPEPPADKRHSVASRQSLPSSGSTPADNAASPIVAAQPPPPVMYAQPLECPVSYSAAPQPVVAPAEAVFVQAAPPLAYSAAPQLEETPAEQAADLEQPEHSGDVRSTESMVSSQVEAHPSDASHQSRRSSAPPGVAAKPPSPLTQPVLCRSLTQPDVTIAVAAPLVPRHSEVQPAPPTCRPSRLGCADSFIPEGDCDIAEDPAHTEGDPEHPADVRPSASTESRQSQRSLARAGFDSRPDGADSFLPETGRAGDPVDERSSLASYQSHRSLAAQSKPARGPDSADVIHREGDAAEDPAGKRSSVASRLSSRSSAQSRPHTAQSRAARRLDGAGSSLPEGGAAEDPAGKRPSLASRQSHRSSTQGRPAREAGATDSFLPEEKTPEHPAEKRDSVASHKSHRSSTKARSARKPGAADSILPEGGTAEHPVGLRPSENVASHQSHRSSVQSRTARRQDVAESVLPGGGVAGDPADKRPSMASQQSDRSSAQARSASRQDGGGSLHPAEGARQHPASMHALDSMESAHAESLDRLNTDTSEGNARGHPAEHHDSNGVVQFSRRRHLSSATSSAQATDC
ncbi:unnamed protein product [Prorocentrum cordatum]|uniref:EF-hand domain-containing protein n=1 Tax=Prorocentrum cordatum TaxID=2364126 RepID=A0ABN9T7F9_9DINO|nr:unnamed protein product [Polarella glacialis]